MFKFDDPKMGSIKILNVTEARAQLASLLSDKQADYIITKNNKPQRVVINYEEFERLKSLGGSALPPHSVAAQPGGTAVIGGTATEQGRQAEESPRPSSHRGASRKQTRRTPPRHVKGLLAEQSELSTRSCTPPEARYDINTPDVRRETTVEITPGQRRRLLADATEGAAGDVAVPSATAVPVAVWPDQGPAPTVLPEHATALETAVIASMAEETVEQDYFASDTAQDDAVFGEEAGIPSPDEAQGVEEKSAVIKDPASGAHGVTGQKTTQVKPSEEVSDEITDKARVRLPSREGPPSREGQPRCHAGMAAPRMAGTMATPVESSPEADYYRRFKKLYEPVDPAVVAPAVPKRFPSPSPSHVAAGAGNHQDEDRGAQAVPMNVQQASKRVPPSSGKAEIFGTAAAPGVTPRASAVSQSTKVPIRVPKAKEPGASTDLPSLQDLLRDLENERLSDEGEKLDDKQIDDLIHRITNDY